MATQNTESYTWVEVNLKARMKVRGADRAVKMEKLDPYELAQSILRDGEELTCSVQGVRAEDKTALKIAREDFEKVYAERHKKRDEEIARRKKEAADLAAKKAKEKDEPGDDLEEGPEDLEEGRETASDAKKDQDAKADKKTKSAAKAKAPSKAKATKAPDSNDVG